MPAKRELAKAAFVEKARRRKIFDSLFDKQQLVAACLARFISIKCARRSGKTWGAASIMLDDAQRNPGQLYFYIALSGPSARNIAWPIFKKINRLLDLGCEFKEGTMTIHVPGGSIIIVLGADREDLHDRFYGPNIRMVIIDECAVWRTNLLHFIREILKPTVAELRGKILLLSMPSPILAGYFYDITRPEEELREPGWDVFEWSTEDNPYMIEQAAEELEELRKSDPDVETRAWFQRAWRGRWVKDSEGNVYNFDVQRNRIEGVELRPKEQIIICLDTGQRTAFTVAGWSPTSPDLIFYESYKADEMLVSEPEGENDPYGSIVGRFRYYRALYEPQIDKVGGPSILYIGDPENWQLLNELSVRHGIPIEPAQKTKKQDWQKLVNDAFVAGRIKVVFPEGQPLGEELVTLKRAYLPSGEWVENPMQDNHCTDDMLYTFRSSYQYLYREPEKKPKPGTAEADERIADKMLEMELKAFRRKKNRPWWQKNG